ncbi:MAG TPA: efflux RND transporter periplasmic adaptor subunit [Candidatus Dormibacteraeota bacterium]|nr:efflux RND transporter periplasmic adaptor subunit [Candidatus Dormibacteraeota bacterium]
MRGSNEKAVRWIGPVILSAVAFAGCGSFSKPRIVAAASAPDAAVVPVTRRNFSNTLQIASEFQPYQEIDVYAKVSGYIKKLYVDYGTHVQQGQLMAVLEIPELKQQVQRDQAAVDEAREDFVRATSAYKVAHITYERLAKVQKTRPELISQEEIDVAQGKDLEGQAGVSAAQQALLASSAALAKDKTLYAYAHMTAPFAGVVTRMYAYTGALLPAGTSSNIGNSALCHLAQNDILRLVIPVPERAVPDVRLGESVEVQVSSLNRTFSGKIVRTSDQIDLSTRTMHTEVQVNNPSYQIVPGMYATVSIPLHTAKNVLAIPLQAVQSTGANQGTVLVVNGARRILRRQVTLGLQNASNVEVVSGLKKGDLVIFGDQSQFQQGELVEPKVISAS